jgi:hypothetical protein
MTAQRHFAATAPTAEEHIQGKGLLLCPFSAEYFKGVCEEMLGQGQTLHPTIGKLSLVSSSRLPRAECVLQEP